MNKDNNWTKSEKLSNIDPAKIAFLNNFAQSGTRKSQQEIYSSLLNAASETKEKKLSFTSDEINTIMDVLKQGKSKAEQARINKIIQLMDVMNHKKR